jgi:hypothetical protein
MSRFLADHLPAYLVDRLSHAEAFANARRAIVLCTVDEHGWPHPSMVSSLELIALDTRNLRLALHGASRSARNLAANGRLTVVLADEHGVFYLKGDVLKLASFMAADQNLAAFNVRVDSVLQDDAAAYEDARITTGITVERGGVDESRAHAVLHELLAVAPHAP